MPSYAEGLELVRLMKSGAEILIFTGNSNNSTALVDDGVGLMNWAKRFEKVNIASAKQRGEHVGILPA